MQNLVIPIRLIFFHHSHDGICIHKARDVVDMSIRIVSQDAIPYPENVLHPVVVTEVFFNLGLVELRIAIGIEKTGLGGELGALAIEFHRTSFHHDPGSKVGNTQGLGDMNRNLIIQVMRGVFFTPGIVVPLHEHLWDGS